MKAKEVSKNVYFVGAIDFNVRNFHGYSTDRGSSYNAYLILDEQITVIDTVKKPFCADMIARIQDVTELSSIKNIIINHSEPDHSGSLPMLMELAPQAMVYADKQGAALIKKHYGEHIDVQILAPNSELNIGNRTLKFIETPMVHWPDNMVTYIKNEGILFSNDAFGQHIASYERMDDEFDLDIIRREARKYYANIVQPYGKNAERAFAAITSLDINTILPSHGIGFKQHVNMIVDEYSAMIQGKRINKGIVIFDTMWGSTEAMANAIAQGLVEGGATCKVMSVQHNHISDIITEVMDASYVAVGSPTLNNGMLPTIASMLCYMKGLLPPDNGKKFIAFGSYGWGGQSVGLVEKELLDSKMTPLIDKQRIQFVPTEAMLAELKQAVRQAVKNN